MKFLDTVKFKLADAMVKSIGGSWGELTNHFDRLRGGVSTYSTTFKQSADYLNAYQLCNYVANQARIIATDIARLEWEVVDENGKKIQDPRLKFLDRPGVGLNTHDFVFRSVLHYLLDGNAFWMTTFETLGQAYRGDFSLLVLNPATVDIYDKNGRIITAGTESNCVHAWKYQVRMNARILEVAQENMIQCKMPSPVNPMRGMGIVQQNAPTLDADRMTTIFNNAFFQQGAKIPYVLMPKEQLSPISFKQAIDTIRRDTEGASNWGKMFISPLSGDLKSLSMSHNDMQYLEQKQLTKNDVREMFCVPVIRTGGADARFDSALEQKTVYYETTLPGYAAPLEFSISALCQRVLKRDDVWFRFVFPKVYNLENLRNAFDRGVITRNEYREAVGYSRDTQNKSLDDYYISMSFMPADYVSTPEKQEPTKQKKVWGDEEKLRLHRRAQRTKARTEKTIMKAVKAFYAGMEERCLEKAKSISIHNTKMTAEDIINYAEEVLAAKNDAKRWFMSALAISVNDSNEMLGTNIDASSQNQKLMLKVERLAKRYADLTIDSRREEIRSVLSAWQMSGEPISELSGKLKDYFGQLKGENAWMAQRIARTEASHAWDQASMLGYDELGVAVLDVIGCEDQETDCNRKNIPRSQVDGLVFHPNHTGSIVPSI